MLNYIDFIKLNENPNWGDFLNNPGNKDARNFFNIKPITEEELATIKYFNINSNTYILTLNHNKQHNMIDRINDRSDIFHNIKYFKNYVEECLNNIDDYIEKNKNEYVSLMMDFINFLDDMNNHLFDNRKKITFDILSNELDEIKPVSKLYSDIIQKMSHYYNDPNIHTMQELQKKLVDNNIKKEKINDVNKLLNNNNFLNGIKLKNEQNINFIETFFSFNVFYLDTVFYFSFPYKFFRKYEPKSMTFSKKGRLNTIIPYKLNEFNESHETNYLLYKKFYVKV